MSKNILEKLEIKAKMIPFSTKKNWKKEVFKTKNCGKTEG
jgi:hypothetical protein